MRLQSGRSRILRAAVPVLAAGLAGLGLVAALRRPIPSGSGGTRTGMPKPDATTGRGSSEAAWATPAANRPRCAVLPKGSPRTRPPGGGAGRPVRVPEGDPLAPPWLLAGQVESAGGAGSRPPRPLCGPLRARPEARPGHRELIYIYGMQGRLADSMRNSCGVELPRRPSRTPSLVRNPDHRLEPGGAGPGTGDSSRSTRAITGRAGTG